MVSVAVKTNISYFSADLRHCELFEDTAAVSVVVDAINCILSCPKKFAGLLLFYSCCIHWKKW